MDLADRAAEEDLTPFDPWGEPPIYPEDAGRAVTLRLDGSIVRELEIDVIPWRDVAAYRFETVLGNALDGWTEDEDPY